MVQPPKEELAKLRKVTESPEDQYRREQAALAAALDEFLAEHDRTAAAQAAQQPAQNTARRRRGDRGRNAERAERALEAEVEREKEKEKSSRHRTRHRNPPKNHPPVQEAPLSEFDFPELEELPHKEPTPRRRHRGGRGRGSQSHSSHQEKPKSAPAQGWGIRRKEEPSPLAQKAQPPQQQRRWDAPCRGLNPKTPTLFFPATHRPSVGGVSPLEAIPCVKNHLLRKKSSLPRPAKPWP